MLRMKSVGIKRKLETVFINVVVNRRFKAVEKKGNT